MAENGLGLNPADVQLAQRAAAKLKAGEQLTQLEGAAIKRVQRYMARRDQPLDAEDRHRSKAKERSRIRSAEKADIGLIPVVVNPERREACRLDLLKFLVTYFPESCGLSPFGADHIRLVQRLQEAMLLGGRFANAVYRGAAKTTISECAAIWGCLYGHQRFIPVFAADASLASGILDSIKKELFENDLLIEDFPEVTAAILHLGGKSQGARSQTYNGRHTHIAWSADKIVFPTIVLADSRDDIPTDAKLQTLSSGAMIAGYGMTGSIRGLKHKRPDGTQQRPTFALVDDPQTDESAGTAAQVHKRMRLLRKTILRAAGHRTAMGCVVNGTIIKPRDMMHQLTDHLLNPDFQSERIPLLHKFADRHKDLWLGEYKRLRTTYDPDVVGDQARAHDAANEFYAEHHEEMNAGCVVSWESCFDAAKETSAVQHAYNILIDDGEEVFQSECQQDPLEDEIADGAVTVKPATIAKKLNGHDRLIVPHDVTDLTAMIDVQQDLLFWCVTGLNRTFGGHVVGYGAFPDQQSAYYTLGDCQTPMKDVFPGKSLEATLWAGLEACVDALCGREWARDDGTSMRISKLLIDANWGKSTKTVYSFARQSKHSAVIIPSHGHYIGASGKPMAEYTPKAGERYGPGWMIPLPGQHPVRHVTFDSNYWKSFAMNRLQAPMGSAGCIDLFGDSPRVHEMFADHLTAEYFVTTSAKGRSVDEWKLKPHNPDNHWLDCFVGTCVAGSILGCRVEAVSGVRTAAKKRRTSNVSALNI